MLLGSSKEHKYNETLLHPITRKICGLCCSRTGCFTGEEDSPKSKHVPKTKEKVSPKDFPSHINVDTINEKLPKPFCYTNDAFNVENENHEKEKDVKS